MKAELCRNRIAIMDSPERFTREDECGPHGMVKIELEVAEALACLAHSAIREGDIGYKSVNQRAKSESMAGNSELNPEVSSSWSSVPTEDQVVVVVQQREKVCNKTSKPVEAEQGAELIPSPMCTTSYAPSGRNKSRKNLTEAEKEARRLHRVLANRASARQTIHRRQAIYVELTRKAADLALENDSLKREKELAMREYDSLKTTNECLKVQTAKIMKAEVQEIRGPQSTHVETSTSRSTNCPVLVYNHPSFMPFLWPSIVQSSNPVQLRCHPQNGIAIPSGHKTVSSTVSRISSSLPEKNQEPVTCPSKVVDGVVVAAEARKRRKELINLKNLHCQRFHMHC